MNLKEIIMTIIEKRYSEFQQTIKKIIFILCLIGNTRLLVLQVKFQEQCILLRKDLVKSVFKNKFSNFTKKSLRLIRKYIPYLYIFKNKTESFLFHCMLSSFEHIQIKLSSYNS